MTAVSNFEYSQTFEAGEDLVAGRFVIYDPADNSVKYRGSDTKLTARIVGITTRPAKMGVTVPVMTFPGMSIQVETNDSGAIAAGDTVGSTNDGRAVKSDASDTSAFRLGVCLGPDKAAGAQQVYVRVMLN